MPKKTPELIVKRIERAILSGDGSYNQIAQRHGVSKPTVERIARSLHLHDRKAATAAASGAIAATLTEKLDLDALLLLGIQSLADALPDAPVKSMEGAAGAMSRLIETYRKLNPMTMDELIDLALNMPNFDPRLFAQALRDRVERGA
jgi:DNA-binding MurR/RpiR family transcriptional regulator